MRESNEVLFTERFQAIYDCLGMFSYIYAIEGYEGIDRDHFIDAISDHGCDTPAILGFLGDHGIIKVREGLLHLDLALFYELSVWDLLVMAEPWVREEKTPGADPLHDSVKQFGMAQKLNATYIDLISDHQ